MMIRGGKKPDKFSIDPIPNNPGWFLCRFAENPHEYTEKTEDGVITGWEYEEYHLRQSGLKESLERDILGNYDVFLAAAKAADAPPETEQLRADTDFLLIMGGWR